MAGLVFACSCGLSVTGLLAVVLAHSYVMKKWTELFVTRQRIWRKDGLCTYEEGTIFYLSRSSRGKQWHSVTSSLTVGRRKLNLPKTDNRKFGGEIIDFLTFGVYLREYRTIRKWKTWQIITLRKACLRKPEVWGADG